MNLMRWDPMRELEEMATRLNRVFVRPQGRGTFELGDVDWAPVVDVTESPEEFLVTAELPGVAKEEVKVSIKDGVLVIRGERRQEKEEKGKQFHRVERMYGTFMRSFAMPEGVDEAKVMAEHKDGMLMVHLPKSPVVKPKAMEVKVH